MSGPGHLQRAIGAAPPRGLDVLGDADAERLASLIDGARDAQREALVAAIDNGLAKLPRLLRGPVRKLLR